MTTTAPAPAGGPAPPEPPGRTPVRLHLPEEPVAERRRWRGALLAPTGTDPVGLDAVVGGDDGITDWLWRRWRALEQAGMGRADFAALVAGYRRELWLWVVGERTWAQCAAGLIGRVERRLPG